MYTVDIHSNRETTKEAIEMLESSLQFGRRDKDKVICVITGYGSKSGHGRIKEAVIAYLEQNKGTKIKDYLLGNEIDIFNKRYQECKYKDRLSNEAKNKTNSGIIYIFL